MNTKQNIEKILAKVGPVVRTAMQEAIKIIQNEAATFIAKEKVGYDGEKDDVVTTADNAAQACYLKHFAKELPELGLIGEEDNLKKDCTIPGEDIYITIDPLDGTKAFARHQSHGVGTMVGVVRNGKVIAGYIGDINTGDIYGFAPDAPVPTRTRFGAEKPFAIPLGKRYVMLNGIPKRFPKLLEKFIGRPEEGGLFKDADVIGESYGTYCARLWKNEVAVVLLDPAFTTPWDETPVLGICNELGFVRVKVDPETCELEVYDMAPPKEIAEVPFVNLFVHKGYLPTILEWFKANKA